MISNAVLPVIRKCLGQVPQEERGDRSWLEFATTPDVSRMPKRFRSCRVEPG
jgi:hypothetical protein